MSTVVIKIDDVDITADVFIKAATFTSLVNGQSGPATFRVKDATQSYDFISGGALTLDIDDSRVWGGYVMQAQKNYLLVSDTTDPSSVARVWTIVGADYNILFSKRLIYKLSDPADKVSWNYDASTYDDTIINDLFDNFLELSGDGLTRTGVQRIAHAILDVPGKVHSGSVASAGYTWKQSMDRIARETGGIYYIDSMKDLHYVDVEESTSDYSLTDTPTTSSSIGFQSFDLLDDGTKLVNDMFVWGSALGSKKIVFSRSTDAPSVAAHGRKQLSIFSGGLYRQASADIVADSYVYGTPESLRGGKDDIVTFSARVFEPVFRAGDVVDVTVGIFDYNDVLPVRRMTTTFVSPTEPIFDLALGHEVDQAVGIWEYKDSVPYDDNTTGPWLPPPPPPPPPPPGCDCGDTDTFANRTLPLDTDGPGFGRASGGLQWRGTDYNDPEEYEGFTVVDGYGKHVSGGSSYGQQLTLPPLDSLDVTFWFESMGTTANDYMLVSFDNAGSGDNYIYIDFNYSAPYNYAIEAIRSGGGGTGHAISAQNVFSGKTWCRVVIDQTKMQAKVWPFGDPEPEDWTVEAVPATPNPYPYDSSYSRAFVWFTDSMDDEIHLGSLSVVGADGCGLFKFDNFLNRNLSGDMGISSTGYQWIEDSGTSSGMTVGGGRLVIPEAIKPAWHVMEQPPANFSTPDWAAATEYGFPWGSYENWDIVAYVNAPGFGVFVSEKYDGFLTGGTTPDWASVVGENDYVTDNDYDWYKAVIGWDTPITLTAAMVTSGIPSIGKGQTFFNPETGHVYAWYPDYSDVDDGPTALYPLNEWPVDGYYISNFSGSTGYFWDMGITEAQAFTWLPTMDMTTRLRLTDTDDPAREFSFQVSQNDYLTFHLSPITDSPSIHTVALYTNAGADEIAFATLDEDPPTFVWEPDVDYIVRWQLETGSTSRVKVWKASETEPGDWLLSGTSVSTSTTGEFGFVTGASTFLPPVITIYWIDFDFEGKPCYIEGGSPVRPSGNAVASSGRVCETISHSGGSDFATSNAFFSGSLEVWVNGLRQSTFTYTGALGEFSLPTTLSATDVLLVCYRANGDPI